MNNNFLARMKQTMGGNCGFTLLEIIVTLIIMGILAAIGGMAIVHATRGYITTRDNAEMTQKAQLAMSRMTREIEEMTDIYENADASTLPLKNVNGTVTIGYSAGAIKMVLDNATSLDDGDILIDNVKSLTLTYYVRNTSSNSWLTTNDIRNLTAIDITMQINCRDGGYLTFVNRIAPRNNKNQGGALPSTPSTPPPTAGNYGGCFVATAVYGDAGHPMVVLLREFRDRFLLTWNGGKWFVKQYYTHGPVAAEMIRNRPLAMWAVRCVLTPLAVLTFFLVYAPLALLFIILISMIFTWGIFLIIKRKQSSSNYGKFLPFVSKRGSILISLIVTMTMMAALGAAMLPIFSSSYLNEVYSDQGRKAYFLAESGFRYAASKFFNAGSDSARQTALTNMNNKTCNLSNNRGSFTLIVYPYWFNNNAASAGANAITANVYGTFSPDQNLAGGGYLQIGSGNNFYQYSSGSVSGTTVTFALPSSLTAALAANQDVLPVVLPASSSAVTKGGNLTLSGTGVGAFPALNGNFTIYPTPSGIANGTIFNYAKRVENTLYNITLADNTNNWTNFTVTGGTLSSATKIILDKFLRLTSTGTAGSVSRSIIYNVPVRWLAGSGGGYINQQYHETFNSMNNWLSSGVGSYSVATVGGGSAARVSSVSDNSWPGNWAIAYFNWASTKMNLAEAWMDAGGCLSYDLQVKVYTNEPYFMAGLGFRMRNNSNNSDLYTYGTSFIRQRQTNTLGMGWVNDDSIDSSLRPFSSYPSQECISSFLGICLQYARYSDPAIILWQRNGPATSVGSFKLLAYRTITAADNLTTGSGTDLGLKPWSTLLVRLLEGYELQFSQGRVDTNGRHLKSGDTIRNNDGSKMARIVGTPIVTTDWGGINSTTATGSLILTNVTGGGFSNGESLYLDGGISGVAYARASAALAAAKANYIMIYYSDNKTPAAGNTTQADNTRIGNPRDNVNWPPADWTDRAAANDYFSLIQWYSPGLGANMAPPLTTGNWALGTGWTITSNRLRKSINNNSGTAYPNPALAITAGVTYDISVTVTNYSSGSFNYSLGGDTSEQISANGTYTKTITANSTANLIFTPTNNSSFRITAVSVRPHEKIPTLDTTADSQGNVASFVPALSSTDFYQAIIKTAALVSPSWTSSSITANFVWPNGNSGDSIGLVTSSSSATSTSYDDFAIQLYMKGGAWFFLPIQQ